MSRPLTPEHFYSSFALTAIDALVMEIDSLKGSTFAGDVDDRGIFNKPTLTSAHFDHPTSLMAVRFLSFARARVLGIRPIVEGVQRVANRLE